MPGDYTPSFRNSVGELAPTSPAVSVMATAGSFCNDDMEAGSNVFPANDDLMNSSKNDAIVTDTRKTEKFNDYEEHTVVSIDTSSKLDSFFHVLNKTIFVR